MEKLRTYLIGSMQFVEDGGVEWRDKLAKTLVELGFDVQNPCETECNKSLAESIVKQKEKLENLLRGGEYEKFNEIMNNIQQHDLTCVNNSKFVIVLYDPNIPIGGTVEEIIEAHHKGIPIYTVSYQPQMRFNHWILARLRQNFKVGGKIFENFKQLVDYIKEIYAEYIKENQNEASKN